MDGRAIAGLGLLVLGAGAAIYRLGGKHSKLGSSRASMDALRLVQRVPGGAARNLDPRRYDPRQLAVGTRIEMEHTGDRRVAREIAMDHLTEDGQYYTKLCRWHQEVACRGLR